VAPEFSAPHALTLLRAYSDGPRDRQATVTVMNSRRLMCSSPRGLQSTTMFGESGFVRCGYVGCQLTALGHEQTNRPRQSWVCLCTEQTLEHCEIGSVKMENRDLPRRCEHLVGARAAWAEFPPRWRNGKL
jgi:hypothetical protein